jgi:endoglucanase
VIKNSDMEGLPEGLVKELSEHNGVFTKDTLEKLMMLPVQYAEKYGLPLYCGEWGCLPTVPREIRMQWYADVRDILEKHNIAWANWDYKGGFGIISRETGEADEEFIQVLLPVK